VFSCYLCDVFHPYVGGSCVEFVSNFKRFEVLASVTLRTFFFWDV